MYSIIGGLNIAPEETPDHLLSVLSVPSIGPPFCKNTSPNFFHMPPLIQRIFKNGLQGWPDKTDKIEFHRNNLWDL